MSELDESARAELRAAWDDMLAELGRARDALDRPELMPPPASSRNLAEGYRYLAGFLHNAVERAFFEDPQRPVFQRVLQELHKATIDNADAIYFAAAIDGRRRYRVTGQARDHRHWRGEAAAVGLPKAPQYLIFEASAGPLAGDTGSLAELRPGVKAGTGRIDSSELQVEADGRFEILLAPERPSGHLGNFLATFRPDRGAAPGSGEGRYADYVSGRQLFYDWEYEEPVGLQIEALDGEPEPVVYGPERAAAQLRRLGALVRGPIQFWNAFYTRVLETYGKAEGAEGERFMPRNAFNAPNAAARETGGGQSTNIYAGGVYELGAEEALLVESRVQEEPAYIGFHLANLWGESHDYAGHQSSLNGFQTEREPDGALRWVIAHRDPGVANWLDTTGHPEGFMAARWSYSQQPLRERWPTIRARKLRLAELGEALPADMRRVGAEERARRIRLRRAHVQRRFRAF